jgi:hypothetical protein
MMFVKADYLKHREMVLYIIEEAARRNNHDFAQQVDEALLDSRAFLLITKCGFIVLQPTIKDGLVWVNIMFAYSWGTTALGLHMEEIYALARKIGARGIELYTVVPKLELFLTRKKFTKDSGESRIQHWIKRL